MLPRSSPSPARLLPRAFIEGSLAYTGAGVCVKWSRAPGRTWSTDRRYFIPAPFPTGLGATGVWPGARDESPGPGKQWVPTPLW